MKTCADSLPAARQPPSIFPLTASPSALFSDPICLLISYLSITPLPPLTSRRSVPDLFLPLNENHKSSRQPLQLLRRGTATTPVIIGSHNIITSSADDFFIILVTGKPDIYVFNSLFRISSVSFFLYHSPRVGCLIGDRRSRCDKPQHKIYI